MKNMRIANGRKGGMITVDELNQVRRIICKRYKDIKGDVFSNIIMKIKYYHQLSFLSYNDVILLQKELKRGGDIEAQL